MSRLSTILILIFLPLAAGAADMEGDSLLRALSIQRQGLWHSAAEVFDNVAIDQWRMPLSLTTINAGYNNRSDNRAVDPQRGKSEYFWDGGATTYTRYRSSTLSGSARYHNGRRRDVRWCESADIDIIYPYLMADSVGGDIKSETYEFSGEYADHKGKLSWGASLAYRATLEYRDVDPRPRNVSGTLDASVALGYNIASDYHTAIDIDFRRYTQSNDMEFMSEMGVDKIFHLTGPLQHYVRFGGTGLSTHYQGYRYGVGLALYPSSGHGAFARVHASRFHFDNILSDFNKLPLARAYNVSFEASAGWLNPGENFFWAGKASISTERRHGRENIFGDASSNIYPHIASIDMFARNMTTVKASWTGGFQCTDTRISLTIAPYYEYSSWLYLNPRSMSRTKALVPDIQLQCLSITSAQWLFTASAGAKFYHPFGCIKSYSTVDKELSQLLGIEQQRYKLASGNQQHYNVDISATYKLSKRMALGLTATYTRSDYTGDLHSNTFQAGINLIF